MSYLFSSISYTMSDAFWQIIRLCILSGIIFGFWPLLDPYQPLSILLGSLVYFIVYTSFLKLMYAFTGLESLGTFDAVFFLDDKLNCSNIVGAMYFDEFEFDSMREYLLTKSEGLHKCRSKVVKKFGMHFYKKMTPEE